MSCDREKSDAEKCHTLVKGEHPEALVLVLDGDKVRTFGLDALTVAEQLGIVPDVDGMVTFMKDHIETNLQVLAAGGFRLAVAEVTDEDAEDEPLTTGEAESMVQSRPIADGRHLPMLDVDDPQGIKDFLGARKKLDKKLRGEGNGDGSGSH